MFAQRDITQEAKGQSEGSHSVVEPVEQQDEGADLSAVLPSDGVDAEFIPVLQTDRKKPSALFNFVCDLIKTQDSVLKPYKIDIIGKIDRQAIIIQFNPDKIDNLFIQENYRCVEAHLTIDAFYATERSAKGISGFTYAHHTERYQAGNSTITIHAYFNQQGQYFFCQVKDETGKNISVSPSLENAIKNNSAIAAKTLLALLGKKNTVYKNLSEEIKTLEATLAKEFAALMQTGDRGHKDAYLAIASQFVEKVTALNILLDQKNDMRGEQIERIITKLKNLEDPKPREQGSPTVHSVQGHPKSKAKSKHKKPPNKTQRGTEKRVDPALKKQYITQLSELNSHLLSTNQEIKSSASKVNVQAIIEAQRLSSEILLAQLDLLSSTKLDEGDRRLLKETDQAIKAIPNITEVFKKLVQTGNVQGFVKFFEHSGNQLDSDFYYKLLEEICNLTVDNPLLMNKIAICQFLFKNSEPYRLNIAFFEKMLIPSGNQVYLSFLFRTASNNMPIFSMLLEHGFNPNGFGMMLEGNTFPILKCLLREENKQAYIECLLKFGASIPRFQTTVIINPEEIKDVVKHKQLLPLFIDGAKKIHQEQVDCKLEPTFDEIRKNLISYSELYLAFRFGYYALVPDFCELSQPDAVALAIGQYIFNMKGTRCLIASATESGTVFFPTLSTEQLEEKLESYILRTEANRDLARPVKYLIASGNQETANGLKVMLSRITSDSIDNIIKQLEAKNTVKTDGPSIYWSCLILASLKPSLTSTDREKMMRWSCKLGANCIKTKPEISFAYFVDATRIATEANPSCKKQLLETDIYKYAEKQIRAVRTTLDVQSNPAPVVFAKSSSKPQKLHDNGIKIVYPLYFLFSHEIPEEKSKLQSMRTPILVFDQAHSEIKGCILNKNGQVEKVPLSSIPIQQYDLNHAVIKNFFIDKRITQEVLQFNMFPNSPIAQAIAAAGHEFIVEKPILRKLSTG